MPIRLRLAIASAVVMAIVLALLGTFVVARVGAELTAAVDAGLISRAETVLDRVAAGDGIGRGRLAEADEAFAQLIGRDGTTILSSTGLTIEPLIDVAAVGDALLLERAVATDEETVPARLLALPAGEGRVLVVGASLEDQREAITALTTQLVIAGPIAVGAAGLVGWLVAGAALRPVDRLRREAEAVSASEPGRALPVPAGGDELTRLGESLNVMLRRLESAVERERRFVGDASHELRTPLANLKAELDLALGRARTTDELTAALRSAAEETDRLAALAEELLVLARAADGRLSVRRDALDLGKVVQDTAATFRARAAERKIELTTMVDRPVRIAGDEMRLRQATTNLLDNALRHTPPGGRVAVRVASSDGRAEIVVADSGPGFDPDFLPDAFEPFARADAARAREGGGTGLGLAIVRAIAEAHGGTAVARNRPDGGAQVELSLPALI